MMRDMTGMMRDTKGMMRDMTGMMRGMTDMRGMRDKISVRPMRGENTFHPDIFLPAANAASGIRIARPDINLRREIVNGLNVMFHREPG